MGGVNELALFAGSDVKMMTSYMGVESMRCSICGGGNVTWRGPLSNLTHTECAECGGRNCQEVEPIDYDDGSDSSCPECVRGEIELYDGEGNYIGNQICDHCHGSGVNKLRA